MEGRGRKQESKKGGGLAIMVRKERGWLWNRLPPSQQYENEDVMALKIENNKWKGEHIIAIICYMTTGNRPADLMENKEKLGL